MKKETNSVPVWPLEAGKLHDVRLAIRQGGCVYLLGSNGRVYWNSAHGSTTIGPRSSPARVKVLVRFGVITAATAKRWADLAKASDAKESRRYTAQQFVTAAKAFGVRLTKAQLDRAARDGAQL